MIFTLYADEFGVPVIPAAHTRVETDELAIRTVSQ